jgi:hypothetical protein
MESVMSLHRFPLALFTVCGLFASAGSACGQTVQQPVVEVFGVTTTVSVPDRGSIHLGSVSRAAEGRTTAGFGPFRSGSGYGRDVSHSGMSASVYIHDLREMDAAVLNQAAAMQATQPRESRLNGYAAHAYSQLTGRPVISARPAAEDRIGRTDGSSQPPAMLIRPNTGADVSPPVRQPNSHVTAARPVESEAERFLRLGRQAEAAGKTGLARLHYQAAARHGSREAARLLTGGTAVPVADRQLTE